MELLVLHAAWGEGAVHLWGESLEETPDGAIGWRRASGPELIERLGASAPGLPALSPGKLTLLLPSAGGNVLPSPRLSHWIGSSASRAADSSNRTLAPTPVETASTDALNAPAWLDALDELGHDSDENQIDFDAAHDRAPQARVIVGDSVRFFAAAARMARSLLAEQRFVPMALQDPMMPMAPMRAAWQAPDLVQRRRELQLELRSARRMREDAVSAALYHPSRGSRQRHRRTNLRKLILALVMICLSGCDKKTESVQPSGDNAATGANATAAAQGAPAATNAGTAAAANAGTPAAGTAGAAKTGPAGSVIAANDYGKVLVNDAGVITAKHAGGDTASVGPGGAASANGVVVDPKKGTVVVPGMGTFATPPQ